MRAAIRFVLSAVAVCLLTAATVPSCRKPPHVSIPPPKPPHVYAAWPQVGGNARCTSLSPYVGAQTGGVKWAHPTRQWMFNSPVVTPDGTVVAVSDAIYAVSPVDGSLRWRSELGGQMVTNFGGPAVAPDGTVYVGSWRALYAVEGRSGRTKWRVPLDDVIFCPPTIGDDGTIYVGGQVEHYDEGTLYAIEPKTGKIKWRHRMREVYSPPAVGGNGTLYVTGFAGTVAALNVSDGKVKWGRDTGRYIQGPPAIGGDGTVYVSCGQVSEVGNEVWDGRLFALDPSTGRVKWARTLRGGPGGPPALGPDGTVYVTSDVTHEKWVVPRRGQVLPEGAPRRGNKVCLDVGESSLLACDPDDGSVRWTARFDGWLVSSPSVGADGVMYIGFRASETVIPRAKGAMYALSPAGGSLKWSCSLQDTEVESSPAIGADGTVYVGCDDGKLYAFGPTKRER